MNQLRKHMTPRITKKIGKAFNKVRYANCSLVKKVQYKMELVHHIEPTPPGGRCTQGEVFHRKTCTPTHDKSSNADLTPTSSDGSREPVRQPRQSMSAENQPGLEIMVPPAGSSPAVLLERFRVPYIPLAVLKPARERSTAIDHFTPGECVSDRTRSRGSSMHL